jgi:ABC-type sugar transport system ATPase subunit
VLLRMPLYVPEDGRVLIDGVDLTMVDLAWLRRQIGGVLQENVLFNCSVRDNIALSDPTTSMERVIAAANLAGVRQGAIVPAKTPNSNGASVELVRLVGLRQRSTATKREMKMRARDVSALRRCAAIGAFGAAVVGTIIFAAQKDARAESATSTQAEHTAFPCDNPLTVEALAAVKAPKAAKHYRIELSIPALNNPYIQALIYGAQKASAESGVDQHRFR